MPNKEIKGKLIIKQNNRGKYYGRVDDGTKNGMSTPMCYVFNDDSLNNKECIIEKDKGRITKITVNGKELPKNFRAESKITPTSTSKTNMQPKQYKNKYSAKKALVPADTKKIITSKIDNYSLKLNKFAHYDLKDKKFCFFKTGKSGIELFNEPDHSHIDFDKLAERRKKTLNSINFNTDYFEVKTDWRLIVGLGNESVYETSITLHPIYGFPYIPGSAIKGVTRNYIVNEYFEGNEKKAYQDSGFCQIFGSPKDSAEGNIEGYITFFDVFPVNAPVVETDLMNPHYSDYYMDFQKPPGDYYNPKPIFFLTVKDTTFRFCIGAGKENFTVTKGIFLDRLILEIAKEKMIEVLKYSGIGAKTSVAYGYFKV